MNTEHPCALCDAAEEAAAAESPDLKEIAKRFGFKVAQLRVRLGLNSTQRITWDEKKISLLTSLVNDGETLAYIAEEFGVSVPRVRQVIKTHEIDTSKGDRQRLDNEISEAASRQESVLAAYKADHDATVEQLAAASKTDPAFVRKILVALGLPIHKETQKPAQKPAEKPAAALKVVKKAKADDRVDVDPAEAQMPVEKIEALEGTLERVSQYLDWAEEPTFEGYIEWASENNAPPSSVIRNQFGSWVNAKRQAQALSRNK